MPWSNQGGGGWKPGGNGGGPWGQPPRGSGSGPPDLEDLLRRGQERIRRVLPGGGGGGGSPLLWVAIALVAVAVLGYSFFTFTVQPNEVGVVLRLGKFDRQVPPGINYRLPPPFEVVYTPRFTVENQIYIGITGAGRAGGGRDIAGESLMLTGDENIVDIDFTVFWRIKDARNYLFNLADPDGTVKAVAESAMREVVGRSNIEALLTIGKAAAASEVQDLLQKTLDEFGAGIQITQVQLLKVDPPSEVIGDFRDVQAAQADQVRARNEAETYANQRVPQARGEASRIVEGASAYRDQIIAEARGKADRFKSVFAAYKVAPDVVRTRIYLETFEQVLAGANKIVLDKESGSGVIPYLPLPSLGAPATNPSVRIPAGQATGARQ